jgi:hypothetical protein
MLGSVVRRERRPLWGTLTLIIAIAIGVTLYAAHSSRTSLTHQAETDARLAAQTQLAPILMPRDLEAPVTGDRATEIESAIARSITSTGPIDDVRIYSDAGLILYDDHRHVATTKPSYLHDLLFDVANGQSQSMLRDGVLRTYVPLWLVPGGNVVVAEMSQPFAPIAAEAAGIWYRLALGLGIALAAASVLFAMTFRARATVAATVTVPSAPVTAHPDIRALEVAKQQAEKRAAASERDLKEVQWQFRTALDELKTMEARLAMHQSHTNTNDDDLQALRDQLRDTSERLHKAEMDNNALRERVAIRQYEFDDLKSRFAQAQAQAEARAQEQTSRPVEVDELLSRLQAAERRAADMEGEVERMESELVSTAERFHLAKLSEALREYDNDDEADESDEVSVQEVEEDDDLFEHPKVFFGVRPRVTHGKVR